MTEQREPARPRSPWRRASRALGLAFTLLLLGAVVGGLVLHRGAGSGNRSADTITLGVNDPLPEPEPTTSPSRARQLGNRYGQSVAVRGDREASCRSEDDQQFYDDPGAYRAFLTACLSTG
jgi:hypothetical protein